MMSITLYANVDAAKARARQRGFNFAERFDISSPQ